MAIYELDAEHNDSSCAHSQGRGGHRVVLLIKANDPTEAEREARYLWGQTCDMIAFPPNVPATLRLRRA